jgi:hypothetical protein
METNSVVRIAPSFFARKIDSRPSELATGFEPRIGEHRKEFRRFSSNTQPSIPNN